MAKRAWLLREFPGAAIDRTLVERSRGEISIGWSEAGPALVDDASLERADFREAIDAAYPGRTPGRVASAAGSAWRFIREFHVADMVLIPRPHGGELHVAEVTGEAFYLEHEDGGGYRRTAHWLTQEGGIPRRLAPQNIQAAARFRLTCILLQLVTPDELASFARGIRA